VIVPPILTIILTICATDSEFFLADISNQTHNRRTKQNFSDFYFISKTILIQRTTNWCRFWNQRDSYNRYSVYHILYSSQRIDTQATLSIFKPTYRYSSQRIDTQATISILKPKYQYSNQRVDTQANVPIPTPIYRYSSQHIDTQADVSVPKPTYPYSSQHIDTQTNVSILNPTYRYRSQYIDTQA